MDLAVHTLQRHGPAIADAAELLEQALQLQLHHASYGAQPRRTRIDDARSMVAAAGHHSLSAGRGRGT
jgi:hypothetical protein